MKPLRLAFEHIGPYPTAQEIDFSQLDEFFLIFGKTGSGKTTIFDAMSYALFGKAPGARASLEKELRSRFSPEDSVPWVSFEFQANGEQWKIYRTLPSIRRKRNGDTETKLSEVTLYRFNESEARYEAVTERTREANERIKEILRLSVEEFSKIVLLPQGEFQKFLEMNSTERVAILEKLFDVSLYDRVTTRAADHERTLKNNLDQKLQEEEKLAGELGEAPEQELANLAGDIESLTQTCSRKESEAQALEGRLANLRTVLGSLQKAREAALEAASLDTRMPHYEHLREQLQAARQIEAVAVQRQEFGSTLAAWWKTASDVQQAANQWQMLADKRQDIEAERERQANLEKQSESLLTRCTELEAQVAAWKKKESLSSSLQETLRRLEDIEHKAVSIRSQIQHGEEQKGALVALTGWKDVLTQYRQYETELTHSLELLIRLRSEYDTDAQKLEETEADIEAARAKSEDFLVRLAQARTVLEELKRRAREAQAALLASTLEEGKPCPVCGSEHHPRPAVCEADAPTEDEIKDAGRVYDEVNRDCISSEKDLEVLVKSRENLSAHLAQQASRLREQCVSFVRQAEEGCPEALPAGLFPDLVLSIESLHAALARLETLVASSEVAAVQDSTVSLPDMEMLKRIQQASSAVRQALSAAETIMQSRLRELASLETQLGELRDQLEQIQKAKVPEEARANQMLGQLQEAERLAGSEDPRPRLQAAQREREQVAALLKDSQEKVSQWERDFSNAGTILHERAMAAIHTARALAQAALSFLQAAAEHQVHLAIALLQQPDGTQPGPISVNAQIAATGRIEESMLDLVERLEACSYSDQAEDLHAALASLRSMFGQFAIQDRDLVRLHADLNACAWSSQQIRRRDDEIREFDLQRAKARQALETRLQAYRDACRAIPDSLVPLMEEPNEDAEAWLVRTLHALEEQKQELAAALEDARSRLAELKNRHILMQSNLARLKALRDEYEQLRTRHAVAHELSQLLSGNLNRSRRVPFKFWVLNRHFSEIVDRASQRLYRMTSGRYQAEADMQSYNAQGNAGLDLYVLDGWNGARRHVGSLSGGEKFMLAISLALGLADIIQEKSGGARLESLFIDEGFGSLDAESLSLAISVLDELRGGKMVGIISHVEELQERIPSRIMVEKGAKGSTILLERD